MKQYIDLLHRIIKEGRPKKDRTGTGTLSIFGGQMRFKMEDGFPLLVLKKTHFKSVLVELLWFLKGDTNIQWLEQNGCSIWREWPYKKYLNGLDAKDPHPTEAEFAHKIKTDNEFAKAFGDLGPVYGKQWVNWNTRTLDRSNEREDRRKGNPMKLLHINQIQVAIDKLKEFPEDRGIIVSAWNVSELKDMALRPCHAFFQLYADELTLEERNNYYTSNYLGLDCDSHEELDKMGDIPKYRLSLQLYQRSCDTFLGVPFNIASYSLLLNMIAQCVNMVAYEFIWSGGDIHVYDNHKGQCQELFGRWDNLPRASETSVQKIEPPLPTIKLNPEIKNIFDFKIEDFTLEGYNPMKSIKAPVAV